MWELAPILSVIDKIAGWGKVPSVSKRGRQALELGHKLELEHKLVVVRGIHPCGV